MSPLVRAALAARRGLRGLATLALAGGLACAVVLDAVTPLSWPWASAVAVAISFVCGRTLLRRTRSIDTTLLTEVELGTLAMIGAFFLAVRADRDLDGDAFAAVYLCLAIVSAFARPAATLVALALGVGLEVAIRMIAHGEVSPAGAAPHAAFMVVFTGFNAAVLRTEIARVRSASSTRLSEEMDRLKQDARSFRLMGTPTPESQRSTETEDDRLLLSGVEEIHQSVLFALRLLRESLGLHTTMLLWQNDAGTHLRISELASDSADLVEGPFMTGDGVFGAALTRGAPVTLDDLRPGYALPYYAGPCPVSSVAVIPVHEHGKIRGLLVADRATPQPFSPKEQALLEEAARYAVRAIHNERVFLQLERAKVEQGKLYRAAETLGSAKSEGQVIEAGVKSAREITSVDYAALTLYDESTRTHEISVTSGDFAEGDGTATPGVRFRHNTGLVSMALENRHPLPYRGLYDDKKQVVFTRHTTPPKMPSIFVLPLLAHDRPLGTLVLGSRRRGAFGEAVRGTLEVLASHMAVSLEGARMLKRLEELATTDGLTGLLNKRAMLEAAEQKIAAARRHGRPLALLIADIDHFKKVNDNHGHDVGDVVIKGLGAILTRAKRTTDAVARFGGEEFVLICDETDERGATQLAERVRSELAKTSFTVGPTADGRDPETIRVTCSIGIATYPAGGTTWDALFKAADTALYASKQGGRNRVTVHGRDKSEVAA